MSHANPTSRSEIVSIEATAQSTIRDAGCSDETCEIDLCRNQERMLALRRQRGIKYSGAKQFVMTKTHSFPTHKLEDFELYESGKKQDIKFMEFVSVDSRRRSEGARPSSLPPDVEPGGNTVFQPKSCWILLTTKMRDGDLVAIVRVVGGKGLHLYCSCAVFFRDETPYRDSVDGFRNRK